MFLACFELLHAVARSRSKQLATYIGWLMHRTWGGMVAGTLFVLPSLLILIGLSWLHIAYGDVPVVAGVLYGVKPAVVAIVLAAAWRMGFRTLKDAWLLAIAAFIAIPVLHMPFPIIVLVAAILGILGGRTMPDKFKIGAGKTSYGPAD
ncbi:MAG: chromate transporter [Burkholderiales bacterium]